MGLVGIPKKEMLKMSVMVSTPVITVAWEVETGESQVQVQHQQHYQDPVSKTKGLGLGASAHACNPNYSGSRDQEDTGSKPVWTNSS
jgi:hypothetical protein